jgi:hypothetical protein
MSEAPFDLQILRHSTRYQQWMIKTILPYLGDRILEIGAGIGNMSRWLPIRELLVVSEADPLLLGDLRQILQEKIATSNKLHINEIDLKQDWMSELRDRQLDTVVSFNVLEHIEEDEKVLRDLTHLLQASNAPGPKRIVTVVPAHQWAFGSVDREYGHFRRYNHCDFVRLVHKVAPAATLHYEYFNIFGLPGWFLMNRIFNKKKIELKEVLMFERICPYVQMIDLFLHRILHIPLGQSLVAVITL